MLAKGPVPAIVLPAPLAVAAGLLVLRLGRSKQPRRARLIEAAWTLGGAAVGAVVFLAIVAPWPAYVYLRIPQAMEIWRAESVDRSTGDLGHEEPFYFYLIRLPLLVAPWTVFFIHGIVLAVRRARQEAAERPWLAFLGAWLVGTLAALSAAAGKQDHYILPLVPACAVLIGMSMRHFLAPATPQAEKAGIRIMQAHGAVLMALAVCGFLGLGWLLVHLRMITPAQQDFRRLAEVVVENHLLGPVVYLLITCFVGGAAAAVLAVPQGLHRSLVALVATFAAAFLLAWATVIAPVDRATTAADFGRQVRRDVPPAAPLFSFVGSNNVIIYYSGRTIPILAGPDAVREELARRRPFYLVCPEKHAASLRGAAGLAPVIHLTAPFGRDEGFWLFRAGGPPPGAAPA
jgi:4-amino-4-deoxy-L-arabinose transferase-like glycosyltransferase